VLIEVVHLFGNVSHLHFAFVMSTLKIV